MMWRPRAPGSAARGGEAAGTRQCAHQWAQGQPRPRTEHAFMTSLESIPDPRSNLALRVCGTCRSLGCTVTHRTVSVPPAVWDLPQFSWAHRQPATHTWPLLQCAALGRSAQCRTPGFPGLTVNPQHTLGSSCSVRHLPAPHSVGPAVSPGSPPARNMYVVPLGLTME